ncbi:hypothetical protein O3P69_009953 [Scylla paramamosain]|uniref:Uncharacterized protein n=1 Tax=Scylla paramamosain TaxID=85552 RepID=A0AAW0SPI1_SCYPA
MTGGCEVVGKDVEVVEKCEFVPFNMVRGCLAAVVVVVVVGVCLNPTPAQAGSFDFSSLLSSVANTAIKRLFVEREIDLFDHYCVLSRSPHIYSWELKFEATVTCPRMDTRERQSEGLLQPHISRARSHQGLCAEDSVPHHNYMSQYPHHHTTPQHNATHATTCHIQVTTPPHHRTLMTTPVTPPAQSY